MSTPLLYPLFRLRALWLAAALAAALIPAQAVAQAETGEPIPIRVVIVTHFEVGSETGDTPGELQRWVENLPLPETLPFPAGQRALRYNPDKQVLAVLTGIGTKRAAMRILALGLDPRFDLTKTYWLIAGIAGANPDTISIGSAAWADWVIDGDLGYEIDAREIPPDWPTGYFPFFRDRPYEPPRPEDRRGTIHRLNPTLVDWAYGLTADMALPDSTAMAAWRSRFTGHEAAQAPPRVMRGDVVSAMTFWHGTLLNRWAADWVTYWTDGAGTFATSAMEDTGTLGALALLDKLGRADRDRALVLRTTSNFTTQHPGIGAAESMQSVGRRIARPEAIEAAYAVGSIVVEALLDGWDRYADTVPGNN